MYVYISVWFEVMVPVKIIILMLESTILCAVFSWAFLVHKSCCLCLVVVSVRHITHHRDQFHVTSYCWSNSQLLCLKHCNCETRSAICCNNRHNRTSEQYVTWTGACCTHTCRILQSMNLSQNYLVFHLWLKDSFVILNRTGHFWCSFVFNSQKK